MLFVNRLSHLFISAKVTKMTNKSFSLLEVVPFAGVKTPAGRDHQ